MSDSQISSAAKPNFLALVPFLVFMVFYLLLSIVAKDFYAVPVPVAFIVASATAFLMNRKSSLAEKVDTFARGMGEENIMIMCLIFVLAGIFASIAKGMGAVDAAVVISRHLIPGKLILLGLFLVSCFISISIGTSCGTIAALTPIAVTLTEQLGQSPALMVGAVVGGAMFGDNLSIITDTTIATTRTQGVQMRDKFLANIWIALPAAIICIIAYLLLGRAGAITELPELKTIHFVLIIPYVLVLVCAVCGMNVMAVLFIGSLLATAIGCQSGTFNIWEAFKLMSNGISGMSETLIVAILAGGLLGLIRHNGGTEYLIEKIKNRISSARGCEFGIVLLEAVINLFTANNTVAIVIAGPIARELSGKFNCVPKRIASILDTTSCVVQGLIPYGAQILIAIGLVKSAETEMSLSSFELIRFLFYPQMLFITMIVSIAICRKNTKA
ncbi:MAG: Na+/H+ antiporter NhaC family protein [Lentisphaeria bacterium]|nr:Na+/H+ antiporter NhaC family protein [Lentisphaeria bacterium]